MIHHKDNFSFEISKNWIIKDCENSTSVYEQSGNGFGVVV